MKRQFSALVVGLLFLLGASGCASLIYTDPGPNPARLTVPVKGEITQAQVDAVKDMYGGPIWLNTPPRFDTLDGPYWDVQAFILTPDGGLFQLPPAPDGAILWHEGMGVEGTARFLCPPGEHQLRLLLTGYLIHTYYDWDGKVTRPINLNVTDALPKARLASGQEVTFLDLLKAR